ncbi:MAG: DUF3891 family protein [Chloroflexi bacterium]|nr:DUF3891 family protein [Ardenticatenaceae bacterium]MBL1127917.1 DUF3891 family protein [Chloroflexota bacterium]NOG33987.1 DUF3891 family protein [Chloroflexota bacterium]GIK55673.1 MAG: hypothetical protein BroJett015_13360 [Chloroflexota bacterium]
MIIQTTVEGQPHFAIEQPDHARMCGQLACAFGNATFNPPAPRDLVVYVVAHHDEGWAPVDAICEQSPVTGLPYHLTQTPLPYLIQTSKGSPDFNEAYHPYCGLLSSMHTCGLFNGRYGLSDFIFIDKIPAEHKAMADALLADERNRQTRLKAHLADDSASCAWVQEEALFNNYKLLQFFDTLALYFHTTHAAAHQEARFLNVPDGKGGDHTITIVPRPGGDYTLTPWVFATDVLELFVEGRPITPQPVGTDFRAIFADTPKEKQGYCLVKSV